jgi:energy-coupling factor transporter transmembrane protein EcfT
MKYEQTEFGWSSAIICLLIEALVVFLAYIGWSEYPSNIKSMLILLAAFACMLFIISLIPIVLKASNEKE